MSWAGCCGSRANEMTIWSRVVVMLSRCRALVLGRRLDHDFGDELQAHLAMLTEEYVARGLPAEEAQRRAALRLGGVAQLEEQRRDGRSFPFLDATLQDVRYAIRACRRSPGFTAVAVLTLGIGIGVNTTVFTLYNAVALRGLPVRDAARLVRLERSFQGGSRGDLQYAFSRDEYLEYRNHSRTLTGIIAVSWPVRAAHADTVLSGQLVSGDYFSELGIHAEVGRLLAPDDDRADSAVVVLSAKSWQERFAGDSTIVGKPVRLNDTFFTVAGVAPRGFIGTANPPQTPDFWAPIGLQPAFVPGSDWSSPAVRPLQILGRLSEATAAARSELTLLAAGLETRAGAERTIAVTPEHATLFGGTNDPRFVALVALTMTVVGLVLLIACANISNMTLARAATRQREIAVRLAMGASRGRLVRQLLTESLLLGGAGGVAGLAISTWGGSWLWTGITEAVQGYSNDDIAMVPQLNPDVRVFTYALVVSVLAGIAFGLTPALHASRPDLTGALKDDGHVFGLSVSHTARRRMLIAGQVAAALALLFVSSLLSRSAGRSEGADPGFPVANLFSVTFNRGTDHDRAIDLQRRVLERLRTVDAVGGASLVQYVPLRGHWTTPIIDGETLAVAGSSLVNYVSDTYFDTMGVPIERGRGFDTADELAGHGNVAIISAATARRLWPGVDPIGRRLKLSISQRRAPDVQEFVVVGIARDAHNANVERVDPMFVYLPARPSVSYEVLVRTRGPRRAALESIRAGIGEIDRRLLPSLQFVGLEQLAHDQQILSGTLARLSAVLATLALLLAAIGIYGVMSFLVAQRIHEIGVRMALGARRADVVRMTLADGLRPVALGGLCGLGVALAVAAVARALLVAPESPDLLFGVGAFDVSTFLIVCTVVTAAAIAASIVPTYRAASVDSMVAVRGD